MKNDRFNYKKLILPLAVWIAGFAFCSIYAPRTTYVNGGVAFGLLLLIIGTVMLLYGIYKEQYRRGRDSAFILDYIFPFYPIVEDKDALGRLLSSFRRTYGEFSGAAGIEKNGSIQKTASQLLWHSLTLWKKRLDKCGVMLEFESDRRAYTNKDKCIRSSHYFDGRYEVQDVYEEIDATRVFRDKERAICTLHDKEVAHYTILSAKRTSAGKIICPNCGGENSRSDLIDGCDYCGTKFSVEDLNHSVGSFGFRRDFDVDISKRGAIAELVRPWVFMLTEMPFIYFGLFGAFIYMEETLIARFFTGLLAAALLGLLGWVFFKIIMLIVVPIAATIIYSQNKATRKMIYRSSEARLREREIAHNVRRFDPLFSLQSFYGGVQNKLSAIHYADREQEINAFSEQDLSPRLNEYGNVIDMDTVSMELDSYAVKNGTQHADVSAELILREYVKSRVRTRTEHVKMHLEKSAECKTQAVCAPSLLKCSKCGSSLSLMEGKTCSYCGNELEMRKYDWVITNYKVI